MANEQQEQPTNKLFSGSLLGSAQADPKEIERIMGAQLKSVHYQAVGRIAAAWAYFESIIDYWLHDAAGIDEQTGVCLTAQMIGPRPRTDAYIALVKHKGADKKWYKILEDFAKDAQGLGEQRNGAIHDVWDLDEPKTPKRREATARRALRVLDVHTPTRDLLDLESAIHDLWWRFEMDIAMKISGELPT